MERVHFDDEPTEIGAVRFARLVDHSADAICVHQDGRFVFFNAVAVRWLGANSAGELEGHAVSRFVHAHSMPAVLARTATLREPGDVATPVPATVRRVDGTEMQVEVVSVMTEWNGRIAYQLILRDLSAHWSTRDTLAHRAALVDHAADAVISVNFAGMVTSWNPAAERIYRRPEHQALAIPVEVAVDARLDPAAIHAAGGVKYAKHYTMDGSPRMLRVSVSEFHSGFVLVCTDETPPGREARHLRTVMDSLQEGIIVVDQNGWLRTMNPAARRILGLGDGEINRNPFSNLAVCDGDGVVLSHDERPIPATFATGLPTINRVIGVDRLDGSRVWLRASYQLLDPDDRENSSVLLAFSDITSQRAASDHLAHQAAHDSLTGLPNRAHVIATAEALLRQPGLLTAILFIDLDDLKTVNDTLGHSVGDVVIQTSATRLRQAVRSRDIVGRWAGDEFVVLLTGNLDTDSLVRSTSRIHESLTKPIATPEYALHFGASIGTLQLVNGETRSAPALLHDADMAMYAAKARARQASKIIRLGSVAATNNGSGS